MNSGYFYTLESVIVSHVKNNERWPIHFNTHTHTHRQMDRPRQNFDSALLETEEGNVIVCISFGRVRLSIEVGGGVCGFLEICGILKDAINLRLR